MGYADKYESGNSKGDHAVRWEASAAVTELGNLGTDSAGFYISEAYAINDTGTAVGDAYKYDSGVFLGVSAVRWEASGAATELGDLGTIYGGTSSRAVAINSGGTVVGSAKKYDAGVSKGERAVRWDASATVATELGNIGTNNSGITYSEAYAINSARTAVGFAEAYESGRDVGERAVRSDASGTVATELGNLGTDSSGRTESYAYAINDAGVSVGYAEAYDVTGHDLGRRAIAWGADGAAIDLYTLLEPNSGWVSLSQARGISDTGWITGVGMFDPGGGLQPYYRIFLMQIPESPGLSLLVTGAVSLLLFRRTSMASSSRRT